MVLYLTKISGDRGCSLVAEGNGVHNLKEQSASLGLSKSAARLNAGIQLTSRSVLHHNDQMIVGCEDFVEACTESW